MEAIGLLMVEHRLIERMVALLKKEIGNEELKKAANPAFIHAAVDFFRMYADRMHHGKEEGILFRDLASKNLAPEHKSMLDQLVNEHRIAREEVKGLQDSVERYERGDLDALAHIITHLKRLLALYPPHIHNEDQHFFLLVREYFNDEERKRMLEECYELDRKMAHEKYLEIVKHYEVA
jgi:hemerythrin-like domain-containing protein